MKASKYWINIVGLCAFPGCFLGVVADDAPSVAQRGACVMCIAAEKERTFVGEPVNVKVVVENHGTTDIVFPKKDRVLAPRILQVKRPNGAPAELTAYGKRIGSKFEAHSAIVLPISPGASLTNAFLLSRVFDMTETGSYTVTAKCWVSTSSGSGAKTSLVESAPVSIEVEEEPDLMKF